MQKKHLVAFAGSLALLASLVLPGISSAQQDQAGQVTVGCGAQTPTELLLAVPTQVVFQTVSANPLSTTGVSTVDNSLQTGVSVPGDHILVVSDNSSGGIDNCPTTQTQQRWHVTAQANNDLLLNGTDTGANQTISKNSLQILTTPIATGTDYQTVLTNHGLPSTDTSNNSKYFFSRSTPTGNLKIAEDNTTDDNTPVNIVHQTNGTANTIADVSNISAYQQYSNNSLGSAVTVLRNFHPINGTMGVGVALAIYQGIQQYQQPGTYTGTITYTLIQN